MIVTFFSLTAEERRAGLLRQVAASLDNDGRSVLVVDFDFEQRQLSVAAGEAPGLYELLMSEPAESSWRAQLRPGGDRVAGQVLGVGNPPHRVSRTEWKRLFAKRNGVARIEALRNEWLAVYDFVLVNAVGRDHASGVALIQLADVIVAVVPDDAAGFEQFELVLEQVQLARQRFDFDRSPASVVPVLAAHPSDRQFADAVAGYCASWAPRDAADDVVRSLTLDTSNGVERSAGRISDILVNLHGRVRPGLWSVLRPPERDRLLELAIFAENADVDLLLVSLLWHATGGLDSERAASLAMSFHDLALVADLRPNLTTLRLDPAVRRALRAEMGPERIAAANATLLDAAARHYGIGLASDGRREWWNLPASAEYLRRHLVTHLEEAGLALEAARYVSELRRPVRTGDEAWAERPSRAHASSELPVFPFYLVCDESGSMDGEPIQAINDSLPELHVEVLRNPLIAGTTRFCVIGFSDEAEVLLPLSDLSQVAAMPMLRAYGGTNYSAAFTKLREAIGRDVAALRALGHPVFRPTVFFLTDGQPNGEWRHAYEKLVDREWLPHPNIVAFGLGEAEEQILREIATTRAFIADGTLSAAAALRKFGRSLTESIVGSALQSSTDPSTAARLVMPSAVDGFTALST